MMLLKKMFNFSTKTVVYALVGKSGTGKSFHAKLLAEKLGAELIIDDGLLINNDKIIAGHSAKKEKTFLAAVRTALFDDKQSRDEAAKILLSNNFKKILILGTSEKMVNKIAERLQIMQPQKIITIEEIATPEDIETAMRSRHIEGKHVIPVPSFEVKKKYSHIFYDKLRLLFTNKKTLIVGSEQSRMFEKSVVRPEFSKIASIEVSEKTLTEITLISLREYDKKIAVKSLVIKFIPEGYILDMTIDVPFGTQLTGKIHHLQKYLIETIEKYTGILILKLNIIIDELI